MDNLFADSNALDTVVTTKADVKTVRDFFEHFQIKIPASLDSALQEVEDTDSIDLLLQDKMKVEVCRAMIAADMPLFKDELFNEVMTNAKRLVFDADFRQQFEEEAGDKDVKKVDS